MADMAWVARMKPWIGSVAIVLASIAGNKATDDHVSQEQCREAAEKAVADHAFNKESGVRLEGIVSNQSSTIQRLEARLDRISEQNTEILQRIERLSALMEGGRRGR